MRRLSLVSGSIVLLVLTSCGKSPKTFDSLDVASRGPVQTRTMNLNAVAAGAELADLRDRALAFIVGSVKAAEQPHPPVEPRSVVRIPATAEPASSLPPDWVIQRESGGDYNAFNATGCGGLGCYGRYQFSGEWAGKLGLPLDISQATPEQQDAAARELWANGAGCSHWNACG